MAGTGANEFTRWMETVSPGGGLLRHRCVCVVFVIVQKPRDLRPQSRGVEAFAACGVAKQGTPRVSRQLVPLVYHSRIKTLENVVLIVCQIAATVSKHPSRHGCPAFLLPPFDGAFHPRVNTGIAKSALRRVSSSHR